jgi:hypothetical protein
MCELQVGHGIPRAAERLVVLEQDLKFAIDHVEDVEGMFRKECSTKCGRVNLGRFDSRRTTKSKQRL